MSPVLTEPAPGRLQIREGEGLGDDEIRYLHAVVERALAGATLP